MSNTISYSIGKCGSGERFNFSQSAANDVTGNNLTTSIPFTTCNRIITPGFTWDTRELSGTATMHGIDENAGYLSSPPLRYLKCSAIGSFYYTINGSLAWKADPIGFTEISDVDGSVISYTHLILNNEFPDNTDRIRGWSRSIGSVEAQDPAFIYSSTGIYWCARPGPLAGGITYPKPLDASSDPGITSWSTGYFFQDLSNYIETLSVQNTEDNAWNKTVGSSGVWSAWVNETSLVAKMQDRGSGFTWLENGLQIRLYTQPGQPTGTPNHQFTITLSTQARPYGSTGIWSDSTPVVYTTTSTVAGELSFQATRIPCPRGYELRISEVAVTA